MVNRSRYKHQRDKPTVMFFVTDPMGCARISAGYNPWKQPLISKYHSDQYSGHDQHQESRAEDDIDDGEGVNIRDPVEGVEEIQITPEIADLEEK